ncbi:hypothetical protein R6L23_21740 [Streptomyces sp. SR27]|nr:hypothetical protein [Streptomyces sp. SR27]
MPQSTSTFHAYDRDVYDPVLVRAGLLDLVVTLAERIRRREQIARKVTLSVRFADGSTLDRTRALPQPSGHTEDLRTATFRILDSFAFQRARIRRITLTTEDLRPADEGPGTQFSLDPARENRLSLELVTDRINQRYGRRLAGRSAHGWCRRPPGRSHRLTPPGRSEAVDPDRRPRHRSPRR